MPMSSLLYLQNLGGGWGGGDKVPLAPLLVTVLIVPTPLAAFCEGGAHSQQSLCASRPPDHTYNTTHTDQSTK